MAFDMKDDFDSDAGNKEVEQFGIWVKKAPEDVVDTPSGDTIQNSTVPSESDDSFDSFNQDKISDSSFLQDLPEPDFDGIDDFDANEKTTDTDMPAADVEDFSLNSLDKQETIQQEQTDDAHAENSFVEPEINDKGFDAIDSEEQTNTADNSFSLDALDETEKPEAPSESSSNQFETPEVQQKDSSFQDFQEEDSAENWEPLDDAPNFNYPSVDNIEVPPLTEPSETEIENSLQESSSFDEQPVEDSYDEINLTDDSSFDAIETASTEETDDNLVDYMAEPEAAETDDDSVSFTDDGFDLPDFGLTPETEDFGNSENAEPIDLTDDLVSLPDFGSTPETEDFGTKEKNTTIDVVGETDTELLDDDFTPPIIEENSKISEEEAEKSPLDEISTEDLSSEIDFSNPVDETESTENTETTVSSEGPAIEIPDDFDTAFDTEDNANPSAPAQFDASSSETAVLPDETGNSSIDSLENFEVPSIDDSTGFVPPEITEQKAENTEEELSLDEFLSDSDGEIDVSSEFGLSSDSSSDITDDFLSDLNAEFGGASESKSDLLDEEPIDIDLEFDDQFASDVQTDASDNIEDESNFDELFSDSSESDSVTDNFDDMFAAIQDESASAAEPSSPPEALPSAEFDEVTEFDDFLTSDSGPDIETEKSHSNKVNKQIDYDITVSQDDVNKTKQTTVEVSDDYETSESIPLYGTSTDADGNKVAFIPQADDENAPHKATLEKSENDDFYENLFADAEDMDSSAKNTTEENTPPFSSSSSADDEETVPITNSTKEQTMKEKEEDLNITDNFLADSPETEMSETDNLTTGITAGTDSIIDVPDISMDFTESDEIPSELTDEAPSVEAEIDDNVQLQNDIPEISDEFEAPEIEDTIEPEIINGETESLPEFSDGILDISEPQAEAEPSENIFADSDMEAPVLDEDETLEAPTLSDEILPENDIPAETEEELPKISADTADEIPDAADESPLEPEDSIIIPTLNEDDEDFVDAAALADSLAETDKLDAEKSYVSDIAEPLEPAEQEDLPPTFDDVASSKENSDNDFPSFDDITSDTLENTSENNFIAADSAPADDAEEENEISNASLYNSILAETFADDSENSSDKTDKNLLDIADNSEYTENKEDEHNMDFDENKLDSGIAEQPTTGVPEQASNISESVLKEISNELSMLRSEISLLKQELSNVRRDSLALHEAAPAVAEAPVDEAPVLAEETPAPVEETVESEAPVLDNSEEPADETPPVVVASESSTGFFDGDVEDETIALSGDELSNILNTADFTEEFVDNTSEDSDHSDVTDPNVIPTAPETMDFDGALEEPDDIEIQELEQEPVEEELSVPKVDDIIVDSDNSEDGFVADIEPETEDSISNDELKYLEEEPKAEEIYDAPAEEELVPETASEPESLEVETVDDSSQEAPVEETEEVVLESDVGPFSEADETPTDAVFEGDQWNEEPAPVEEATESAEPEEAVAAAAEEPAIEATENLTEEGSSIREKAEKFADADQKDLKEEIKSVLLYMDQLLENLPDEKIEEFAQSSYFETYKKLFKELGIS